MASSASRRVLSIPDVVDQIFGYIDSGTCARCTRVCKTWQPLALDRTWSTLKSVRPLFKAMAPMVANGYDDGYVLLEFAQPITPDQWQKIAPLTSRIKMLHITSPRGGHLLSNNALLELAASFPEGQPVFPRLKHLHIGEILAEVVIDMPEVGKLISYACSFLEHIAQEGPSAISLALRMRKGAIVRREFNDRLCTIVTAFKDIRAFATAPYALSREMFTALVRHPSIQEISFSYPSSRYILEEPEAFETFPIVTGDFPLTFNPQALRNLRRTDLQGTNKNIESVFPVKRRVRRMFPNLEELNVDLVELDARYSGCLTRIQASCPVLRKLSIIDCDPETDPSSPVDLARLVPVNAKDLGVLPRFTHLVELELVHCLPMDISDEDLVRVLSGCQNLRKARLNESPASEGVARLRVGVLSRIALNCPLLEHLSVYVDTRDANSLPCVLHTFQHLRYLSLGRSSLGTNGETLALYLAQLLPKNCEFTGEGWTVNPNRAARGVRLVLEEPWNWNDIKAALPLLISFRQKVDMKHIAMRRTNES